MFLEGNLTEFLQNNKKPNSVYGELGLGILFKEVNEKFSLPIRIANYPFLLKTRAKIMAING
jgi:hypothetical protein